VDTIRGAVTASILSNSAPICGIQTSCAGYDPGNGYFMVINRAQLHSKLGEFAITHELGHLVDFLGLDTWSYEDFRKLFSESPNWKSCFPLGGNCTPFLEVFADQFGFFSTNAHGVLGLRRRPSRHEPGLHDHDRYTVGIPSPPGSQPARRLRPPREELRTRPAQQRGCAVKAPGAA